MNVKARIWVLVLVAALVLGLSSTSAVATTEWPPISGVGSITVHKFHDRDRDGIQDAGEEDIEGWLIRIYRFDNTGLYKVREGRTGPDGWITFVDLPAPTRYKVWEEYRECWVSTAPSDVPTYTWDGGKYVLRWSILDQTVSVDFGNANTCEPPCPPVTVDLIAGQHYDAGNVTMQIVDGNLEVTIQVQDGWTLGETHLYVGLTPPVKSAPGRFPYSDGDHFSIPLSDLGAGECGVLYVALHAVVSHSTYGGQTAWGNGTHFGGGWAMYMTYPGCDCTP